MEELVWRDRSVLWRLPVRRAEAFLFGRTGDQGMLPASCADGQQGDCPAFQYPPGVGDKSQAAYSEKNRLTGYG